MNTNLNSYNDVKTIEYYSSFDDYGLLSFEKKIINQYFTDKTILDIGCGTGRTTYPLFRMGYDVIGIDYSEGMIDKAKEKYPMIEFQVGDCAKLSFDSNSFGNALFSFNGIMLESNYDTRVQMFEEIYRILKPNGIFFFTTPYLDNKYTRDYWMEKAKREGLDLRNKKDRMLLGDDETDEDGVKFFLHIPFCEEIIEIIQKVGFTCISHGSRIIDFGEEKAEDELDDNYYWVVRK